MRNALLFLLMIALAPLTRADEPQFLIESFSVSGTRWVSSNIIVAESRLRAGRAYGEEDLAAAMGRIERLPFVLFSEFRLERGSAPGRYVLAISIMETKPLFVSARSYSSWVSTRTPVIDRSEPGTAPLEFDSEVIDFRNEFLTVGGRVFLGAKGVAHVAAEVQREDRYSLGYTHYDVFGTRASITALVSYQDRHIGGLPGVFAEWHRTDDLAYGLLASVPVSANQSIRASWQRNTQPVSRVEPSTVPGSLRYLLEAVPTDRQELGWNYDTTNDALFPTSGTFLSASVGQYEFAFAEDETAIGMERNSIVSLLSERFVPLTSRQTISAGLDLHRRGLDEMRVHARYGVSLWGRANTLRHGDLRFEAQIDRSFLRGPDTDRSAASTARAGFAFRNAWGVARLDFEYVGWRDHE